MRQNSFDICVLSEEPPLWTVGCLDALRISTATAVKTFWQHNITLLAIYKKLSPKQIWKRSEAWLNYSECLFQHIITTITWYGWLLVDEKSVTRATTISWLPRRTASVIALCIIIMMLLLRRVIAYIEAIMAFSTTVGLSKKPVRKSFLFRKNGLSKDTKCLYFTTSAIKSVEKGQESFCLEIMIKIWSC